MTDPPRVCLVSASGQNVFFAEILQAFGAALRERGVVVEESVDCFPAPAGDLIYLFVPHEYNPMVHELARPSEIQLRRSIALNTEQPGTVWFETAAEIAAGAGAVIDINPLGARELQRRGIKAEYAPLGHIAAWDLWGGEDGPRSIDLTFLGAHTERRGRALASCVGALNGRRAEIRLTEGVRPYVAGNPHFLAGERKWRLLADSKVLLNVHRAELGYMEWHRVLGAILNGCVVLSEHSLGVDPLEPGKHFVSAPYEEIPDVLEALLNDPERLSAIRDAAYEVVREKMPMAVAAEAVLRAAAHAGSSKLPTGGSTPPPSVPMPEALPERTPAWEIQTGLPAEQLLTMRTPEVERGGEGPAQEEGSAADSVESLGPDPGKPRVSVLLTVHNQADLVADALRSVALSDLADVEVVVVDDASTDGSVEAIRTAGATLPRLPVRLVRHRHEGGLAAARNLALEHARAELAFVLDADKMLLPRGLPLLERALEKHPDAGFAYGILETFDADGPKGLENWLDWDAECLRYGNYIQAMALIRRSALRTVGGYPLDRALEGWEDFAIWVAMADAGLHGIHVPDFVGRHYLSPHSTTSPTAIDCSEAWATLLRRYPVLAGRIDSILPT